MHVLALSVILAAASAHAVELELGGGGADTIFVSPLDVPTTVPPVGIRSSNSVRVGVTIDPFTIKGDLGEAVVLPLEFQVGLSGGSTREFEITQIKASAIRAKFAKVMPVHVFSYYRDLDRGIVWGADLIQLRVPVLALADGSIVVLAGAEFGVRHYQAPIDTTAFHASGIVEGRAVAELIENWLSAGFQGRIRYDLDTTAASGLEESAMGYLSLLLDEDHRVYARLYGGIEHQASREALGLPTVNAFGGLGIFGQFGRQ